MSGFWVHGGERPSCPVGLVKFHSFPPGGSNHRHLTDRSGCCVAMQGHPRPVEVSLRTKHQCPRIAGSLRGPETLASLAEATSPLGQDALAHAWPDQLRYAFPPLPLILLTLDRILLGSHRVLLVALRWPGRVWFPLLHWCLVSPSENGFPLSAEGSDLAPESILAATLALAPQRPEPSLDFCEPAVVGTIRSS